MRLSLSIYPDRVKPTDNQDLSVNTIHYEYIAGANMTPVLREAMLSIFEPRRFGAFEPCRVRGHF